MSRARIGTMPRAFDGGPARPWGRGLRKRLAAKYGGLGPSTFDREVSAGRAPQPVNLTPGCKVWLREELDDYLDAAAERRVDTESADEGILPGSDNEWDRRLRDGRN